MISIRAAALRSPFGDLEQTFAAIVAEERSDKGLEGSLLDGLHDLIAEGPWQPDLILIASTKGDGPLWIADCLGAQDGSGGPAWLATQLAKQYHCAGLAVSVACASGPGALAVADLAIRHGDYERVLVLGADRLMAMVRQGFQSLNAIDESGSKPFDEARAGLSLGEVMAALWCEKSDTGPWFLEGWGLSCDANHLTGPQREGAGLRKACELAMGATRVDLIVAHGTGTRYNDDAESHAYFALSPTTAVTSWKGSLGHSLGSCGIAEAALSCHALRQQAVPGISQLRQAGTARHLNFLKPGLHPLPLQRILSANAGFGGLNGAVVIGTGPGAESVTHKKPAAQLLGRIVLHGSGWEWLPQTQQQRTEIPNKGLWPAAQVCESGSLPRLTSRQITGNMDSSWGRMDLHSRLAVTMAHLAHQQIPLPRDCAMLLLSDRTCAESDRLCEQARRRGEADPQRFAYTLPSTALGEVSIRLGLHGPAIALPGGSDQQGAALSQWLIASGQPMVLLLRVEADQPPQQAWLEIWTP